MKKEVAKYMRRLYEQKLTSCSSGNVSARLNENLIAITPSQTDKAYVQAEDIGLVSITGKTMDDTKKLSMEAAMHLGVYRARPDVMAIVHAHPVYATSFAVAQKKLDVSLTGESFAVLGEPILAPYALMGSDSLAENVANAATKGNVILLQNHGVLTVGKDLYQAYDRMEIVEFAAKIQVITQVLGDVKHLDGAEKEAIRQFVLS